MKTLTPHFSLLTILVCTLFTLFTFSCESDALLEPSLIDEVSAASRDGKSTKSKIITHYGPAQPIAGGVMRSMVQLNKQGEAVAIGMMISERSLYKLPEVMGQYVLDFHQRPQALPLRIFSLTGTHKDMSREYFMVCRTSICTSTPSLVKNA